MHPYIKVVGLRSSKHSKGRGWRGREKVKNFWWTSLLPRRMLTTPALWSKSRGEEEQDSNQNSLLISSSDTKAVYSACLSDVHINFCCVSLAEHA
jgi:hypothetical protein